MLSNSLKIKYNDREKGSMSMYRVMKLYGDSEPWWFLDGWEEDIVTNTEFDSYEDALRAYQKELVYLSETYPQKKTMAGFMTAFWDSKDQIWCEECDEYLQQYHSVLLLEIDKSMPKGLQSSRPRQRIRPCQIKH